MVVGVATVLALIRTFIYDKFPYKANIFLEEALKIGEHEKHLLWPYGRADCMQ